MKLTIIIVILALACVGLGIALFASKKQADEQHTTDVKDITDFSNQVVDANEHLKEAGQVNLTLSNDLAVTREQITLDAEKLTQLSNSLTAANATLADTKTSLVSADEMITNLNNRVSELETQNKFLDQQAESLSNKLAHLTTQIEDTRNQLAVAETNQAFLQGELQKQLAQKAELEHRFNDVDELRSQVKKLKEEIFVARRVEFMKTDYYYNMKGAQLLMIHGPLPTRQVAVRPPTTNYDLNVEIGSDGSVRTLPPTVNTNAPAPAP
jgi:chaperonin cofactor prefoldin